MMQSVQVVIERLKSNPEDFFGGLEDTKLRHLTPKFSAIRDKLDNLLTENQDGQVHRLWYLEPEEKAALLAAYKEARRVRFEAKVFNTLLSKQEPEERSTVVYKTENRYPKSIVAPQNMLAEATKILSDEFDKQYAKNRNT
jgi:hypothetical protein